MGDVVGIELMFARLTAKHVRLGITFVANVMERIMESAITVQGPSNASPRLSASIFTCKPGDRVKFFVHPDGTRGSSAEASRLGIAGHRQNYDGDATLEDMDEAIAAGVTDRSSARRVDDWTRYQHPESGTLSRMTRCNRQRRRRSSKNALDRARSPASLVSSLLLRPCGSWSARTTPP